MGFPTLGNRGQLMNEAFACPKCQARPWVPHEDMVHCWNCGWSVHRDPPTPAHENPTK